MAAAVKLPAQTVQTLWTFNHNSTNGAFPFAGLTLGNDGNFYGTTYGGYSGSHGGLGTVFKVTTNGTLTKLVYFNGSNGEYPYAALTLGNDGNFYGTTSYGGSHNDGTVFKVTTDGTLTTLYSFTGGSDGAYPQAALTLGSDGNFYGTTFEGGSGGAGTVFKVTANGTLTTLVYFNGSNGATPTAALTLGNDGNFYGTTGNGGNTYTNRAGGYGTVFKVTANGTLTTLVSFALTNGAFPYAGLTLGNDGNFYGTTYSGGNTHLNGGNGYGTVFKVITNGTLTTLIAFNSTNGAYPQAALTLGNDGNFYGTTSYGAGTVFKVTANGTLTKLVSLEKPNALTLGSDGNFYGTTEDGGSHNSGTVFCLLLPPPSLTLQLSAGCPLLHLSGMLSNNFVVQYSTNLANTNWINLLSLTNLSSSPCQFLDPAGVGQPARFYRAVQLQ